MKTVRAACLVLAASLVPAAAHAQAADAVIYLVRHAETASDGTQDPPLSDAGRARAGKLARMLEDAGLTAIHTTGYARTRGTAEAVAMAVGLTAQEYDPRDLRGFAATLLDAGGRTLVVGHSNTTPALVQLLGGDPGGPIAETDYGRVYQLTIADGRVHTAVFGYLDELPAPPARRSGTSGG